MRCTWSRGQGVTGTGVDIRTPFLAANHVATGPVDVAARVGAPWIGDGVPGRFTRPGGRLPVGGPYRAEVPPDQATVEACHATAEDTHHGSPAGAGSVNPARARFTETL